MIHVPQDWTEKLLRGFNFGAHWGELQSARKQIMPGLKVWAISVVAAVAGSWAGIWGSIARAGQEGLQRMYPNIVVHLTPVHFSNQFIWVVSWFAVALVVQALLSGRSKASAKSVWWYIGRFMVTSIWVGGCMGIAIGISSWVIRLGSKVLAANIFSTDLFVHAAGSFIGFAASLFLLLALVKATLNGMTFGAALFLQGKTLADAYKRGSKMLNNHWPYVIGLYVYFVGFAYALHLWVVPSVPAGSSLAVVLGGVNYLLWPLYWAVFLPYHKRASRKK